MRKTVAAVRQLSAAQMVAIILLAAQTNAVAAGPADEAAIRNAYSMYAQQRYVPSADAFEALIRTSAPSARLYYYAAAANKAAGRIPRAKQLCQYITANFASSPEAPHAQKLFAEEAASAAPASGGSQSGLPAHLKGKSIDELMSTEEGRQALKNAMSATGAANGSTAATGGTAASGVGKTAVKIATASRPKDLVFTAAQIAADGPDGITPYVRYPDAGLECSMAALALLPRGQELLAGTIRKPGTDETYIVRFPNSARDYTITAASMEKYRMKDKALWASLIHSAVRESTAMSLDAGLSLLTGTPAEKILANNTTEQAVSQFISEGTKRKYPVVCLSVDSPPEPELVEEFAGYTIIDFDSATGMITLRNPHGSNSRRFRLEDDPQHKRFEQLNNGYFKMHLSLFVKNFKEIARAPI